MLLPTSAAGGAAGVGEERVVIAPEDLGIIFPANGGFCGLRSGARLTRRCDLGTIGNNSWRCETEIWRAMLICAAYSMSSVRMPR